MKVCFNSGSFLLSISFTFLLVVSLIIVIVIIFSKKPLVQQPVVIQQPQPLPVPQTQVPVSQFSRSRELNTSYPTSVYIPRDTDFDNFKNIGYIYNSLGRFPLYMNRLNNRYYYYTRDDSRNNIKITIGDPERGLKDEFFDGDNVSVPELSPEVFNIKIYENQSFYNPNIF